MPGAEFRPKGVNDVIANIMDMEKKVDRQLAIAMADVVFKVQDDAKKNAPVLTGLLKDSIFSQVFKSSRGVQGKVISPVNYAAVQEVGGSNGITGKFYLTRAAVSNKQFITDKLGSAVKSATIRARGKKR